MSVVQEYSVQLSTLLSSTVLFLTLIVTLLTVYHFWFQSLRSTKLGNQIPGFDSLPLIGDAFFVLNTTPTKLLKKILIHAKNRAHLKIHRVWFGNRLAVLLKDPNDVEQILGSSVHLEKSPEYDFFEPWLGDGLLISNGEKWRSHRKMIAPTFHQSILKTFVPVFNKNAQELVQRLNQEVVQEICDIHDYMSGTTVDILLETVMGVKKTSGAKSSFKYAKAVMDMCAILHFRHVRLWMRPNFIFRLTKMFKEQLSHLKIIHTLTDSTINQKKIDYVERIKKGDVSLYSAAVKETEQEKIDSLNYVTGLRDDLDVNDEDVGQKKRLAFLDFMIEASQMPENNLNDKEIRNEVNTLMFEGHDTTAAASSFFICILGVYPDIQEKVYRELQEIFQGSDRDVTFNDTLEMKYLQRVLYETLRMFPPVPVITRIIREEVHLPSGYILPKDTTVAVPQFLIHNDPDLFPDPEKFDPDRFLPENCQNRHYYSFIPFSAGPRSCVGRKYAMLKLKILLAHVVRNFKITSVVKQQDFELQGDIILKRGDGFRVILEKRL